MLGAAALVEVLGDADALARPVAQSGEATYAAKLRVEELHLEPGMTVEHARRVVRLGRAFTVVSGRRLRVASVADAPDGPPTGAVSAPPGRLLAGFADGALELAEVVPEGGRVDARRVVVERRAAVGRRRAVHVARAGPVLG